MHDAGIKQSDWAAVDYIITRESSWRLDAVNSIGCIGLGQNCPDKNGYLWLVDSCPNWRTDAICQLKRFGLYAQDRYGGWQQSKLFRQQHNWW